jgi:hypothetical protein
MPPRLFMMPSLPALLVVCVIAALHFGAAEALGQPRPQDAVEAEVMERARIEPDPATKIRLLTEWTAKYPESDYRNDRLRLFMRTHQAGGNTELAIERARDVLDQIPGDFEASFTIAALAPELEAITESMLTTVERVVTHLLTSDKPATLTVKQWAQVDDQVFLTCYITQGWVQMLRNEYAGARRAFEAALEINSLRSLVSCWLDEVDRAQNIGSTGTFSLNTCRRKIAESMQAQWSIDQYLEGVVPRPNRH